MRGKKKMSVSDFFRFFFAYFSSFLFISSIASVRITVAETASDEKKYVASARTVPIAHQISIAKNSEEIRITP